MRFTIQPEPRPEQNMRTVTIDEIVTACENDPGRKPPLEHYFSPTKKAAFIKEFLHYLNSGLLEAKHGNLDKDQYLAFILSFQFTAPLLEIPAEKELGLFFRILQKSYRVEEVDMNLHFSMELYEGEMVGEKEALEAFRSGRGNRASLRWQKPLAGPLLSPHFFHSPTEEWFIFTGKPLRESPTGSLFPTQLYEYLHL